MDCSIHTFYWKNSSFHCEIFSLLDQVKQEIRSEAFKEHWILTHVEGKRRRHP